MIRSHIFATSGDAYNSSQTDEDIRDGDVLLVPSEGRAAVLVQAWPTFVFGTPDPESPVFHMLDDHTDWIQFDGGKYHGAAVVATALATAELLTAAGLPSFSSHVSEMNTIARLYGWEAVRRDHLADWE